MSSGSVLEPPASYMTLLNTTMLNTIMLSTTTACLSMLQRYVLVNCEVEVECRNPRS